MLEINYTSLWNELQMIHDLTYDSSQTSSSSSSIRGRQEINIFLNNYTTRLETKYGTQLLLTSIPS